MPDLEDVLRLIVIVCLSMLFGCTAGPAYRAAPGTAEAARYHPVEAVDVTAVARGKALVERRCATCHAVGPTGDSPRPTAPPLRHLGTRYPVTDLQEAFAEGISNGHQEMPQITLEADEIAALIAYLQDIQNHSEPKRDYWPKGSARHPLIRFGPNGLSTARMPTFTSWSSELNVSAGQGRSVHIRKAGATPRIGVRRPSPDMNLAG